MNIRQAKQRFTELTGLPANKDTVFSGIWQSGGQVDRWFSFAWSNDLIQHANFDPRCTDYWVSLVKYLESLQEVL